MSGPTLSRYTPSVMAADLLERLFVARDRVLDEVVRRVGAASSSVERNHTLLVGPRGAGKTHLVALLYHRAKAMASVQVAWLPEDPWTIVSYRHLLAEVCARLEPPVDGDVPRSVDELERLLHDRASAGGPIVVIVENLDQILRAIEDEGQQQLRHLLQDDRSLLLVATSTTLDRSLSDQASPFYGFFSTTRLEPFTVAEAREMLTAIARERNDERLVDYLASDEGEARLRTIEHLAGGQPRMWATLASALTVEGLDDLVDLLLTGFDDLTPYYQEQLARLSGHQRLVVSELAEADRPLTVKDLAERLEIDQRSVGKTVSDLADRRWIAEIDSPVTALLDKRRTYYELAEPMARLSFQIKDTRGEPLRLVVDFLKHWFDPDDLRRAAGHRSIRYLAAAQRSQSEDAMVGVARLMSNLPDVGPMDRAVLAMVDDALDDLNSGYGDGFLALPSPVRLAVELRLASSTVDAARAELHESALVGTESGLDSAVAQEWLTRSSALAASGGYRSRTQLSRWQALTGDVESGLATFHNLGPPPGPVESHGRGFAAMALAASLTLEGRGAEGYDLLIAETAGWAAVDSPNWPIAVIIWLLAINILTSEGRVDEAAEHAESLAARVERIDVPMLQVMMLITLGRLAARQKRRAEAQAIFDRAVDACASIEPVGTREAVKASVLDSMRRNAPHPP